MVVLKVVVVVLLLVVVVVVVVLVVLVPHLARGDRSGSCRGGRGRAVRPGGCEPLGEARRYVATTSSSSSWRSNWVRYRSAYTPPAASSSSWRPRSTMRPSADDEELIGTSDRREPVGDDDRGAPLERLLQRPLDRHLRLGVEVGSGLVQDDDIGCLEQQAGERDALLLAAREPVAAIADDGLEPVGQRLDERQDLCAERASRISCSVASGFA